MGVSGEIRVNLYNPCLDFAAFVPLCGNLNPPSLHFGGRGVEDEGRAAFAKASNFAKASMDKSASQGTSCLSAASIQRSMLDVECSLRRAARYGGQAMLNALSSQAGVRALAIPRRRDHPSRQDLTGKHPGRR